MISVKIKSSSSVNVSRTQPSGAGLTRELLTKQRKEISKNCVKQRFYIKGRGSRLSPLMCMNLNAFFSFLSTLWS